MARYGVCKDCHESLVEDSKNFQLHATENPGHEIEWYVDKPNIIQRVEALEKRMNRAEIELGLNPCQCGHVAKMHKWPDGPCRTTNCTCQELKLVV